MVNHATFDENIQVRVPLTAFGHDQLTQECAIMIAINSFFENGGHHLDLALTNDQHNLDYSIIDSLSE